MLRNLDKKADINIPINEEIQAKVRSGEIYWSCFDCAAKLRSDPPYDGTYTQHSGICQICNETKTVTSARKLFGYHQFI